MIFNGKIVKTDDDYAFVLVDNVDEICAGNCAKCGGVCGVQKPVWKTVNKIGAKEGDSVQVENKMWKSFIGKLPEVIK